MQESAVTVARLRRVFKLDALEFADPDPTLTPDEVRRHLAPNYGGLLDLARVSEPVLEGDRLVYAFEKPPAKTKG